MQHLFERGVAMTVTAEPTSARSVATAALLPTLSVAGTGAAVPVETLWPGREFPVDAPEAVDLARRLAAGSAGAVVADASDAHLVDLVVGWQQLVGLAAAEQARVVRELAARQASRPSALVAELSAALSWTAPAAHVLVARAEQLGELTALDSALRDGSMDTRKVDVLLDELATLTARTSDDAVADGTDGSDEPLDPRAAALARRRVADRIAADAFGLTTTQVRRAARRAVLAVDPAATATRARRAVADRRVTLDWAPDGMAWISAFLPAADAMVVRTVLDAAADATDDVLDGRSLDQRRADTFTAIFATIAETGSLPCGEHLPARRRVKPHIQVTVAATTLLGMDETPAELAGYGPISAATARQIAADATWRRLLTDPANGALVERGARTYSPGVVLGAHVVARDITCTFPGCVRPAGAAELDHITPFRRGVDTPQTTGQNLHAACKRHDIKTDGHWKVRRTPGGGVAWTSAAGITYARHPEPVLVEPGCWHHEPPGPARWRDLGPPPF
jgi:hypothetical protein